MPDGLKNVHYSRMAQQNIQPLVSKVFKWATTSCSQPIQCTSAKNKLKLLIQEWPKGQSPSLLVQNGDKLGHFTQRNAASQDKYPILVSIHKHTSEGALLDPESKWASRFGAGGIPGVGFASSISRGTGAAAGAVGSGLASAAGAASCAATFGLGPGCGGKRKTRNRKHKKSRSKKTRKH